MRRWPQDKLSLFLSISSTSKQSISAKNPSTKTTTTTIEMVAVNQPSPPELGQASNPPPTHSEALKDFLAQLAILSSGPNFGVVSTILDENVSLKKQLQSKDDELAKLQEEIKECDRRKEITINEMFEANQKEKAKQQDIRGQVHALEVQMEEKERALMDQIGELTGFRGQVEKLESDNARGSADLKQAQKDTETLLQTVKEKQSTIDQMKAAGSELKQHLRAAKDRVKELDSEKSTLRAALEAIQTRLSKLEGFAVGYHKGDEDPMLDSFVHLWDYATTELDSQLKGDLPDYVLQNHLVWDKFRSQSEAVLRHHVPLCSSNSAAAKQMRLAVILAILAREIDKHVFQPIYILPEDSQIRQVLADLAASDSDKESFCRAILLSIDPDTQSKACRSRIQAVVRTVSSYLFEMVPEPQFSKLHLSLEQVVEKAAEIWQPIQRAERKYEPDFDPLRWGDNEWTAFTFPSNSNSAENGMEHGVLDENLLTVFPRISRVEKDRRFPLTFVVQLRRSQSQCVAAEQEMGQRSSSSPSIGRMASNRRRMSVSGSNGNHANSATSPPGKKKTPVA